MAKAKENIISKVQPEINWLRDRVEEIRKSVEAVAYDQIEDRIVSLMGATGPAEKVVQTKENIQKALRESLKEYAQLIEVLERLEEKEEVKATARGGVKLSSTARKFMKE